MTITEPTTEQDALWASIGEMPECQLRRGVAADWYEERSLMVECRKCGNTISDGRTMRKGHVAVEMVPDGCCPKCGRRGVWRRGVHFDHQMRCTSEECIKRDGCTNWEPGIKDWWPKKCPTCQGTGYIPDRNGRMAAALRATVDRVPLGNGGTAMSPPFGWYGGYAGGIHPESDLPRPVFSRLIGDSGGMENFRMYPTAAAAIRDLCEAWCKVNYGEVRE